MTTAHRLMLLLGLTLLAGCGSMDWRMKLEDTPENWKAVQNATKRLGYKITYERERELVTRRRVEAGGGLTGGRWARVASKRRGDSIYFAVERWDRVGVALGQGWTCKGNDEALEKKLLAQIGSEPGAKIGTIETTYDEDGFPLEEDTVEVPDDAPEYESTEDFSLQ